MKESIERIDIKHISNPNIVKKLGYKSLAILCHDIRREIIKETSLYGGHLSSNLGVVELTVALYRSFDFPKDKLIFDVGHQCYAHKILTGRSLEKLNAKDGVAGFERMDESPYDCYEAGHSGTAISAAEGFAIARDLRGGDYDVVAVVGDASVVNGLSFEALNNLGSRQNKVIIVINDNDMSISKPVGAYGNFFRKISTARFYNRFKSNYRRILYRTRPGQTIYSWTYRLKTEIKNALVPTTMFDNMGFTYIGPVDGNSIKALEQAFKRAKNATKSVVIHAYTTKGKGYLPAERDESGYWHDVTPFDIETGEPKAQHPGLLSWSHYFGDLTHQALAERKDIVLVTPAMKKGSHLENSFRDFGDRCFDVGIAEEHAVTMAGALSLNGFHPIVCVYSTFLQRSYDELLHDCARMGTDLTLLIDRAGLTGKNGETHMGIYDEAFLKSIPGVILSMPSDLSEANALFALSLGKGHGVFAIRYPHSLVAAAPAASPLAIEPLKWRFAQPVLAGEPSVVAVGPEGKELLEKLRSAGFRGGLANPLFLHPIDEGEARKLLASSSIFAYDAYATAGGFAEALAASLLKLGYKGSFQAIALPSAYIQHASVEEQEKDYGVSVGQAFAAITGGR